MSCAWLEELDAAGRVGASGEDEDIPYILGLAPATRGTANSARDVETNAAIRTGLELGALDQQTRTGLLWLAVRRGDPEAVVRVLESGISQQALLDGSGAQVAGVGQSLCVSGYATHKTYVGPTVPGILEVLSLLQGYGVDLGKPDESGKTLLTDAAASGNMELIRFLVKSGVDVNRADGNGDTPLICAASSASTEVVAQLLEVGAAVDAQGADGGTALHPAVARDDVDLARLLLYQGASVGIGNHAGSEPLLGARSAAMVALLCDAGADPNAARSDGRTPLMCSARASLCGCVWELLARGADADRGDALGATALHLAARESPSEENTSIMQALLDAGADVDEETEDGLTALMVAAIEAHPETIEFLIAHGAAVNARTVKGETALILASSGLRQWGRLDFEAGHREEQSIRVLAAAGADVNATDEDGLTALHHATMGSSTVLVAALLELDALVAARSSSGDTALCLAAAQGHSYMVERLIAAGADVNVANDAGDTPLLLALSSSDSVPDALVCQQLLAAGAEVAHVNHAGESALSLSSQVGVPEELREMIAAKCISGGGST